MNECLTEGVIRGSGTFWGVLKNEQIHHCRYDTRQETIQDITGYIEIFYNRQRRQARLRFLSPAAFERWFNEKRLAA
jgi:putative transposase